MTITFKEYLIEQAKSPAIKDRDMMSKGDRDRTPNNNGGVRSNKRNAQMAGRRQRSRMGKGTGGRNYLDNLFGKGGRPEDYEEEETKMSPAEKRGYVDGRSGVKFRYNQSPAYNRGYERGSKIKSEEEEVKAPATQDMLKVAMNRPKETSKEMQPSSKRWTQRHKRQRRQIGL